MDVQDTWKTIITNSTIEDAEFTYKTSNVVEDTSLKELPTMTVKDNLAKNPISTFPLPELSENDTAPTETYPMGEDISADFTVQDPIKIAENNEPEMIEEFTITDSSSGKSDYLQEGTTVLPLDETQNTLATSAVISLARTQNISMPQQANYTTLEIYDEIAKGGMGVVLKGKQNSLKREIAIKKIINKNDNIANKKKFVMEARVTAFLDHPNIIPVYELGVDNTDNPLITMKLVRGKSWSQILQARKMEKFCSDYVYEQLDILLNVCNALSYAHSKHIIHNDLKPANIMVGEFGEVFVMDWGIAVSIGDEETPTIHCSEIESPMGTPNYMAPELAIGDGKSIGKHTDTYLLGAILYHILMGSPPHHSNSIWESIRMATEGNIPPFRDDIPQELQDICTKALQKNPQDRYQTMDTFKNAIQSFKQHWESIKIAQASYEFIKSGRDVLDKLKSGEKTMKEVRKESPNPYCPLSRALFGFEEALRIWPQNPQALKGQNEGGYLYFHTALYDNDLNIAKAVLDRLTHVPKLHKKLEKKLQKCSEKDYSKNNKDKEKATKEKDPEIIVKSDVKKPQESLPENKDTPVEKAATAIWQNNVIWIIGAVIFVLGMFFGRIF